MSDERAHFHHVYMELYSGTYTLTILTLHAFKPLAKQPTFPLFLLQICVLL